VAYKIIYTEIALRDLEEVMNWSWETHPETSERFADGIFDHVALLKDFPNLGNSVKGFAGIRRLLHSPLYIYYKVDHEHEIIEVLRFWHTARREPDL
jgi:plasmid stabilization system protein ParE